MKITCSHLNSVWQYSSVLRDEEADEIIYELCEIFFRSRMSFPVACYDSGKEDLFAKVWAVATDPGASLKPGMTKDEKWIYMQGRILMTYRLQLTKAAGEVGVGHVVYDNALAEPLEKVLPEDVAQRMAASGKAAQ